MPFAPDACAIVQRGSLALAVLLSVFACRDAGRSGVVDTASRATASAASASEPAASLTAQLAADEQSSIARLPAGAGHDLVLGNCIICHSSTMLEQQHKDSTAWNKTVTTMVSWGAPLPPAQQPVLVAYLAQHFPARAEGASARPAP